jgi:prepilin-type processing-associated H-X9-DG protein
MSDFNEGPPKNSNNTLLIVLGIGCGCGVVMLLVIGILIALLLPAVQAAREAARRMQCINNINNIGLALHNYHDEYGVLPPVMTADENGKPLHSWRVLMLPSLEYGRLYDQIRLDEPWDSDYNKQFHDKMPPFYSCPSAEPGAREKGLTNYSVVVGEKCWSDQPNVGRPFGAMTDGTSNTISIVERKTPVCWMDPTQEITFEKACEGINVSPDGLGSNHTGGINVSLFDGSVIFISNTIELRSLQALFTWDGGENAAAP